MKSGKEIRLYVSPTGSDTFTGRLAQPTRGGKDGPFATIHRARDAARQLRAKGHPLSVLLRGGTYFLDQTFELGPEDSGTAAAPVTYAASPGEAPILSGGKVISDWTVTTHGGKACWTAHLDEVASGTWNFTQLFVNGVRRSRTRRPAEGYFRFADLPEGRHGLFRRVQSAGFSTGQMQSNWRNLQDVDLVTLQHWFESHLRLESVDEAAGVMRFKTRSLSDLSDENTKNARYYVENVFEDLAEPGQWYLDRPTGTLYYLPMPGERPENTQVVAPRLTTLVSFRGQLFGEKIHHVRLENLDFRHAQWQLPECNPGAVQAAFNLPGAVVLHAAEDCVLYGCSVSRVAQAAVEVQIGCSRNRILSCRLYDLGGGGVKINHESAMRDNGDETGQKTLTGTGALEGMEIEPNWGPLHDDRLPLAGRDVPPGMHTEVADCVIRDGGILYHSAHGVWIGDSGHNYVHHNEICNFRYSGISSGWSWTYLPTLTVGNRFEYNHIHHIGMGVLSDLGGIYTLGLHAGSTIRGNHIHDISAYGYGGWGIYLDQASSYFRIEDNVVYRTQGASFMLHYGRDNVVRNNIFALSREPAIQRSRAECVLSMVFENNIVLCGAAGGVSGRWSSPNVVMERNVYWRHDGRPATFECRSFADWQAAGYDGSSVMADPLLEDPQGGCLTLRADSPALAMGFKPLDASQAGPRPAATRAASCAKLSAAKAGGKPIVVCRFEAGLPTAPSPTTDLKRYSNEPDLILVQPQKPQQVSLTVENPGSSTANGRVLLELDPPRSARISFNRAPKGNASLTYRLAPGERKTLTMDVTLAKGAKHAFVRAVGGPEVPPAALMLTAENQPTWAMPRLPAMSIERLPAAMAGQSPLQVAWGQAPAAQFRCAVAGDCLALLAEVTDVRHEQGTPPWNGSCIEIFGSRPGIKEIGQVVLVPQTPAETAKAYQFLGGCCPEPSIQVRTSGAQGGYQLSALVPLKLLKIEPAGSELLLEFSLTTALSASLGEFIRVQPFGAASPPSSNTGYARVRVN